MIRTLKIAVTTTGTAGSAAGTGYAIQPVSGEVKAMRVDWDANAPATSDITVAIEADDGHPEITLYQKVDAKTDVWVYPQVQATGTDGAAIAGEYQHIVVDGRIKVTVAGCDALALAVVVYVYVKE